MEKLICSSCGATLTPNSNQPFIVCEYCDTTVPNAYYVQGETAAAAVNLPQLAIETLVAMGQEEGLDGDCFGTPVREANEARCAMEIPGTEKVYLVLVRSSILWSVEDGLALTDSGMYYRHEGENGKRSWESFITGAIAFAHGDSKKNPGTLSVGSGLEFAVNTEENAKLARFLVNFHNRVYQKYTGSATPADWRVTAADTVEEEETSGGLTGILGTVAAVAGVLGRNNRQRQVVQRSVVQRPVVQRTFRQSAPARPQQPRMAEPPRHENQPAHRQRSPQPGGMFRPTGGPGGRGPGGNRGPGGRGGMGGPGRR